MNHLLINLHSFFRCLNDLIVRIVREENNETFTDMIRPKMKELSDGVEGLEACNEDET